jgi:ferredoxin
MEELEFKEIKRLLNVCYQCGTCVSSCAGGLVNPEKRIAIFYGFAPAVINAKTVVRRAYP